MTSSNEAPPRPFRTWGGWYALVLLELLALIVAFWAFTRAFAPGQPGS